MNTNAIACAMLVMISSVAVPVSGQLVASRTARIAAGQLHFYVSNVDAYKALWLNTLGGVPSKMNFMVRVENALIVLSPRAAGGGTRDSIVDHLGFQVPSLRAVVDRLTAAGHLVVTRAELPPQIQVTNGIGFIPDENAHVAMTLLPDAVKVEFVENPSLTVPISMDHVHFTTPEPEAMRAWYVKVFGAKPGRRGANLTAELPGVRLTFTPAAGPVAPTKGRVLDHIGLEIQDLERFCRELEASGIRLEQPYTTFPAQSNAGAFVIDPWGTRIELTEGNALF
jgi:catechol 2,3-dioxygenase-like lactoylglutathione lyase family enzyme